MKHSPFRHSIALGTAALVLCAVALPASAAAPAGFKSLFNGKDLTGWKGLAGSPKSRAAMSAEELAAAQAKADQRMRDHWSVVEGALEFDGGGDSLCTSKDYGDFELYVDWKILAGGDSGIYLRGSPQIQIWDPDFENYWRLGAEKGSGAFWNNQRNPRFPQVRADNPVGEWNTFYIKMVGERVTIKLNDQLVVDDVVMENYWEKDKPIYPRGQIELQNHGNKLWFRNVYIRELSATEANDELAAHDSGEFESIFNGRDFTGWMGDLENYQVVDGAIVCRKGKGGNALTEKQYTDFVARLEFQLPPAGNNGVVVRFPGTGRPHLDGLELQVLDSEHAKYTELDPRQYHGSIYGLAPAARGYLRPTGEWNYQQVTLNGSRVIVELNGFTILDANLSKITESKDGPVPAGAKSKTGHFGFAGHNDAVAFRNVSIRELPGDPAQPSGTAIRPEDGPIKLFNGKNLAGFYTWTSDTNYQDPRKVFTVKDGLLTISGDGFGGLTTIDDYRDYHLILEFKWGEKTWGSRKERTRDSGLLIHSYGPDGGRGAGADGRRGPWLPSIEAQIIEGGVGDILVLSGRDPKTGIEYPVSLTAEVTKDRDGETVWKKGGERRSFSSGRINWYGHAVKDFYPLKNGGVARLTLGSNPQRPEMTSIPHRPRVGGKMIEG